MSLKTRIRNWLVYPHRIAAVRGWLRADRPRLLDVGCGNGSPTSTRRCLPGCEYHGIDHTRWARSEEDDRNMDRFFDIDLERPQALDAVPDGAYDAVICSHVLEHLSNPEAVLREVLKKVKPGGVLYIEVPSRRSLTLPRARHGWMGIRGCLNFYDDATHKTLVDLSMVARILSDSGFRVGATRPRRMWRRVWLLPVYMAGGLLMKGYIPAAVLWDVTGFAEYLTAVRQETR